MSPWRAAPTRPGLCTLVVQVPGQPLGLADLVPVPAVGNNVPVLPLLHVPRTVRPTDSPVLAAGNIVPVLPPLRVPCTARSAGLPALIGPRSNIVATWRSP